MEDTVIINLYFDRSEKAIQATEEKYSRYCFSIAWNVLYDKEDSDECVNDTWLATWNSIPPRKPAILSAFLGKITRNLAIDCFRRKKAAKRSTEHILELCKELEEIEDLTAYSLNDEIQRKEILEILEKFLESLKKGDCDIFIRRYLVYGQHQRNFSPSWNFRKQNQIQPLSKQKKTMGKGEAFIWKKDLKH